MNLTKTLPALLLVTLVMAVALLCWSVPTPQRLRLATKHLSLKAKSKAEKIAVAKRLLDLPSNAKPGVLWRTYITRLYRLPYSASTADMIEAEGRKGMRYNLISAGLPEWCPEPDLVLNQKANFEQNIMLGLVTRYACGVSLLASEAEFQTLSDRYFQDYKKQINEPDLPWDVWYAIQINKTFWLPKNTPKELSLSVATRCIRALGGIASKAELDRINKRFQNEDELAVVRPVCNYSEQELRSCFSAILEGVRLESPDQPTRFVVWH